MLNLKGGEGQFDKEIWEILDQNELNRILYMGLFRSFTMPVCPGNFQEEGCSLQHFQDLTTNFCFTENIHGCILKLPHIKLNTMYFA